MSSTRGIAAATLLAVTLASGCEPRSPTASLDFCGGLARMLTAVDRHELCSLGSGEQHSCFGNVPPVLAGARRCVVDTGMESARDQIWCALPLDGATDAIALNTASARIDGCLAHDDWRRGALDEERSIAWWRAGDELGRTTSARIVARVTGPSVPRELIVTTYRADEAARHCELLYALVRAADRLDGFAAMRRRATKDGWETDLALVENLAPGALHTKACVIVAQAPDGASHVVCAIDDVSDAEIDGVYARLSASVRNCLWPPMWQPAPPSASPSAGRAIAWSRRAAEQRQRGARPPDVEVARLPPERPNQSTVTVTVNEAKPR